MCSHQHSERDISVLTLEQQPKTWLCHDANHSQFSAIHRPIYNQLLLNSTSNNGKLSHIGAIKHDENGDFLACGAIINHQLYLYSSVSMRLYTTLNQLFILSIKPFYVQYLHYQYLINISSIPHQYLTIFYLSVVRHYYSYY